MRIYVGTTFSRYVEARAVMDRLTFAGHEITHDWTRTEVFGVNGHPLPGVLDGSSLSPEVQRQHAWDDLEAVRAADLVLMLGQTASCGWLVEVGAALARGNAKHVWIVQPFADTVFWRLPQVRVFDDLEDALRELYCEPVA